LVTVRRWKCTNCSRTHSNKSRAREHIARCWWNDDNRTCKTCIFFYEGAPALVCGTRDCNCPDTPPSCGAGVEFPAELSALPIVGCPKWQTRDQEIDDVYPLTTSPRS
jgi:hypothetical protein